MSPIVLVAVVAAAAASAHQQWRTVYEKITQEADHSGFERMVRDSRVAKLDLVYEPVTVFAPENRAVDGYDDGDFAEATVLYHMAVEAKTLKSLRRNNSLESVCADNPPLWITVLEEEYYVNDARIVVEKSNYVAWAKGGSAKSQVLHVIDRVLDPMVYTSSYPNPTAYTFLSHHYKWNIDSRNVMNFLHKIQLHGKEELYRRKGGHTFFIPVDHKTDDYKWENIDGYIIEGHVVPNMVLFTRPTPKNFIYETAANGDYIYIVLSLQNVTGKDYVKSYTVLGNSNHKKGEVLTEIVKANIPVSNGVVHLIKQPLAVFDRELKPFPYLSVFYKVASDPDLNRAFTIGRRSRMNNILKDERALYTYFVPRNRAWSNYLNYSHDDLERILKRHVVGSDSRLTMAKLAMLSKNGGGETTLNSLNGPITLRVNGTPDDHVIFWNDRRIGLYRVDYECSNGIVHVLDDVFAEVKDSMDVPQKGGFWRAMKELVL